MKLALKSSNLLELVRLLTELHILRNITLNSRRCPNVYVSVTVDDVDVVAVVVVVVVVVVSGELESQPKTGKQVAASALFEINKLPLQT